MRRPEIAGLTGLRGAAAVAIVGAHGYAHFSPDAGTFLHLELLSNAVTLFFVLSGFLIYLPFALALADPAAESVPGGHRYRIARIRRIMPGYLVIFLLVNFVLMASYETNPTGLDVARTDEGTGMLTDPWSLFLNLTLLSNVFPDHLQTGIAPSWSLTTELTFYLLLPLVAAATLTLRRRRGGSGLAWAVLPAVVMIAVSVIGRLVIVVVSGDYDHLELSEQYFGDNPLAVLQRSILVYGDNFGLGMLATVAFIGAGRSDWVVRHPRLVRSGLRAAVGAGGLATLVGAATGSNLMSLAFAVFSAALILQTTLPTALDRTPRLGRLFDTQPLHYIGVVSLSLYLWHFPVMVLQTRTGWIFDDSLVGGLGNTLVTLAVATALATATYYGVEKPALRRPRKVVLA